MPELAELGLIRAAVDVTGFGLLGHLSSMCRASGVGAEIVAAKVPVISREVFSLIAQDCVPGGTRQNLETANAIVEWNSTPESVRLLLADAQTSGGLLLLCSAQTIAGSGRCFEKEPHRLRSDDRQNHSLQQTTHMHDRLKAVATSPTPYPNPLPTGEVVSSPRGEGCDEGRAIGWRLIPSYESSHCNRVAAKNSFGGQSRL